MIESNSKAGPFPFPVVGIGASAGGLHPLQCLLSALPRDFGFAVVFVQHLSARHKSLLAELLHSFRADLEVLEIAEGLEVRPGAVYLCPPGKDATLGAGVFHVTLPPPGHVHLAVDEFFASLATAAGERAVGVILSGAGTDGARGVQALRAAGGTVFVQEPATAEHPSMPDAAIATGRVDVVLPAGDIGREIARLFAPPPALGAKSIIGATEIGLCNRLLQEKTGHLFTHYKESVMSRRIARRMALRSVAAADEYLRLLKEEEEEALALAADLMIGVTSFFRDRVAWKALRLGAVRKLAAASGSAPVRVWTPACATGEESYSIAMMLRDELDRAGRSRPFLVFASDVSDQALARAREGIYPAGIAADVGPDYLRRFFTVSQDGNSVAINKEIRERLVFAKQDLLADPPFSHLDLVICRNLLIYLEPEAQERCLAIFHYSLRDGGYLFLGNAESVSHNASSLFKSLNHKKCRVYQKIGAKTGTRLPLAVPGAGTRAVTAAGPHLTAARPAADTCQVQEALLEEYGPAAVAFDQDFEIVYHNGPTHKFLRQPRGVPTRNLLALLPERLAGRLRTAVARTGEEAGPVSLRAMIDSAAAPKKTVTLRLRQLRPDLFLLVFRAGGARAAPPSPEAGAPEEPEVAQLEKELAATRSDLRRHIGQLKDLNEELQAANEELQATNEELETSREELQSLNEELITVNAQLQVKIEEQEETNSDLTNFMVSTGIPTLFLDHGLRIRRFTPALSRLLKLIPTDAGRPIEDMSQESLGPGLAADARAVLEHQAPIRKEIRLGDTWYIRAVLPYRTGDRRIGGVVVTYTDVSELKKAEERTRHLASFPEVNPNPVLELAPSGKVVYANPAVAGILTGQGRKGDEAAAFLPRDLTAVLQGWDRRTDATLHREVAVGSRTFGATVHLVPQLGVVRLYAFDITERKHAETALRQAHDSLEIRVRERTDELEQAYAALRDERQRFYAVLETLPAYIVLLTPSYQVAFANSVFRELFGEARGRPCYEFLFGRREPCETCETFTVLATGASHEWEWTGPNGRDYQIFDFPFTDTDGAPLILEMGIDITARKAAEAELGKHREHLEELVRERAGELAATNSRLEAEIAERRQAEESLRESEARLRRAQEIAHLGSWELDLVKNELTWSDEVFRIFGLAPREFGASYEAFLERVHPDDRAAVDAAYSGSIREGSATYEIEHRIVRRSTGEIRVVHEKCEHFRDEAGRIVRSVGMIHDITERRRSQEAILRAKEEWERTFDSVPDLIAILDAEHRIVRANRAMAERLGTSPVQCIGRQCFTCVHGTSRPPEFCPHSLTLKDSEEHSAEVHEDRLGGDFLVTTTPLFDKDGRLSGTVHVARDITERKRDERRIRDLNEELKDSVIQLEAANRELEAFSSSVSHDLRAPLRSMAGFSQALLEDYAGRLDTEGRDFLERIIAGTHRMGRLIDDLLDLARVTRAEMRRERVSLSAQAKRIAAALEASEPEHQVEWRIAPDLFVDGDPHLLYLVLDNLLRNAFKFTAKSRAPKIEFDRVFIEDEEAYFVRDNGAGLEMAYADKLFKPFQRLHAASEFPGTGIGLATVKRIVGRHGGRVWIEGEPGKGATVFFTLGR